MFEKAIITICVLSLTEAAYKGPLAGGLPADLYPAGLDPRTCPNFPHCTNPAVAASQGLPLRHPSPKYNSQYQRPVYQPRHTATPLAPPPPSFEFVPSPAQPPQRPRPQYIASPPVREHSPPAQQSQYAPPQQYANSAREQQYTPEQKRALDRGEYIGDGDYHGEGLAEALAPEYYGQQQSHRASAATPAVQYNSPAYRKVSEYLAQSQNIHQTSGKPCQNYGYC